MEDGLCDAPHGRPGINPVLWQRRNSAPCGWIQPGNMTGSWAVFFGEADGIWGRCVQPVGGDGAGYSASFGGLLWRAYAAHGYFTMMARGRLVGANTMDGFR